MTRFERKKRDYSDLKIVSTGGLFDLVDNAIKSAYYLTDEEYDTVIEQMDDIELDLFVKQDLKFSEARIVLSSINRIL